MGGRFFFITILQGCSGQLSKFQQGPALCQRGQMSRQITFRAVKQQEELTICFFQEMLLSLMVELGGGLV